MVEGNLWQGLLGLMAACIVTSLTFGRMVAATGGALQKYAENRSMRIRVIVLALIVGACWMAVALFVFNAVAVLLGAQGGVGEVLLSLLAVALLGAVALSLAAWLKLSRRSQRSD